MPPAIEIKSFSYKYPDGTAALQDISLAIGPGERVAIIGPNGAGKSTLLLAISGFVQGTGHITVDGLQLNPANLKKIRRTIGLVLQNPDEQLFMPTVFEDVAFGPLNMNLQPCEVSRRAELAIKTVGLTDIAHRPPHHLSAGQKRCAAIATILSMAPKIVTMDEPDSNLDPRNRNNLLQLLAQLQQTLLAATCNMNFAARFCQRAVLLDNGRVVADRPAGQLMTDAELMYQHGLEPPTVALL
jgi:cobalt/nickel transport system ATP-binding protein